MSEIMINATESDHNNASKKKRGKRKKNSEIDDNKIAKSRIFLSPNYGEKRTLLLLIPGSGAVRAGQWARSICINDNLAAGCMYPFIAEAYKRDWGVVLFDPNGRTEQGRIFSDEHVTYVYDQYIEKAYLRKNDCAIENVLIVCHSAGGMATTSLLSEKTKYLLPRIRAVAGTDTFFGRLPSQSERMVINWVTSTEPLGTILSESAPKRVSAGHTAHEYTSASAFPQIFSFFDAMLKLQDKETVKDKSLETNKVEKDATNEANDDNEECKENDQEQPKQDTEINNTDKNEKNTDSDSGDDMELDVE